MSQAIFPTLPGLTWDVKKTPTWSTKVQQSSSGKELRASYYSWPQYRYTLTYDVLRQSNGLQELQTLAGFFNARQGKYDSFLFTDPNDNAVTLHGFGVGDGATTAYQLQRSATGPRQADTISGVQPVSTLLRTNYLLFSQDLTNAAWSKETGVTITSGGQDPLGGTSAQQINTPTPGNGVFQISGSNAANGTQWTFSVWMRAGSNTTVTIGIDRNGGLDFESTVVNVTPQWQRFTFTHSATWTGTTAVIAIIRPLSAAVLPLCFGMQLELGTSATQYIATTAAAVTQAPNYWPAQGDGFEPVTDLNYMAQVPQIFVNGILKGLTTDYTLSSSGLVTFTAAPAANAGLEWTGSYFWRCRFDLDAAEFNNFLYQLWDLKTLTFVTVK